MDLAEAPPQQAEQRSEDDPSGLSDVALHRQTRQAVVAADRAAFNLAGLINRVLHRQLWTRFGFRDFPSYALASGNGLGINTNSRLWLLKCSLDIAGRDIKIWAEVLLKVDELVRVDLRKKHIPVSALRGNSLRSLATRNDFADEKICYLPSGQSGGGAGDGNLVRLKKSRPDLWNRVVGGEMTLPAARREAGFIRKKSALEEIKKWLPRLTTAERNELRAMLEIPRDECGKSDQRDAHGERD
jgi:hypothetical protein